MESHNPNGTLPEEGPNPNEVSQETESHSAEVEQSEEEREERNRIIGRRAIEIGIKVLGPINYQDSHKKEVDKAFSEARRAGKKFQQGEKPRDRRIDAYLSSFEDLPEEERLEKERAFFEESIDNLLSDAHDAFKDELRDELNDWAEYFSEEGSNLPTWFKLWAWDGMSRLGNYNTDTHTYDKRSKDTLHTYPKLDKEALEECYQFLNAYYSGAENLDTEDIPENAIKNSNFNVLYTHFVHKHLVPTPEYGEKIDGVWTRYHEGQEEEVSRAANCTGWCIVSKTKAKEYLEKGDFIFLHLDNPAEDGKPDYHAAASIRLENGQIAEISGRRSGPGQMLEDALVETVRDKVLSMKDENEEEYAKAFEDRLRLIELSRKEETLSVEDLKFVYEIGQKIHKLEKHCVVEPHIDKLQERYDIETAVTLGVDREKIISAVLEGDDNQAINEIKTLRNLEGLLRLGAPHERVLASLSPKSIVDNIHRLTSGGVSVENIMEYIGPSFIAENIPQLIDAGAGINDVVSRLRAYEIQSHLEILFKNGADTEQVLSKLNPIDIIKHIDTLNAHGANIDPQDYVSELGINGAIECFDAINDLSIDYDIYDEAVSKIGMREITDFDTRNILLNLIGNPKADIGRIIQSVDKTIMPFIKKDLKNRINAELEAAQNNGDSEAINRLETLRRSLEADDDDDDW